MNSNDSPRVEGANSDLPEPLEFHYDARKCWGMALTSVVPLAFAWLAFRSDIDGWTLLLEFPLPTWFVVSLFGLGAIGIARLWVGRALGSEPAIAMDAEGVRFGHHQGGIVRPRQELRIPWRHVRDIRYDGGFLEFELTRDAIDRPDVGWLVRALFAIRAAPPKVEVFALVLGARPLKVVNEGLAIGRRIGLATQAVEPHRTVLGRATGLTGLGVVLLGVVTVAGWVFLTGRSGSPEPYVHVVTAEDLAESLGNMLTFDTGLVAGVQRTAEAKLSALDRVEGVLTGRSPLTDTAAFFSDVLTACALTGDFPMLWADRYDMELIQAREYGVDAPELEAFFETYPTEIRRVYDELFAGRVGSADYGDASITVVPSGRCGSRLDRVPADAAERIRAAATGGLMARIPDERERTIDLIESQAELMTLSLEGIALAKEYGFSFEAVEPVRRPEQSIRRP